MTDHPGHLWQVIQEWLDTFRYKPPSQNELAPKLGVSASSLTDYKYARTMPPPEFLIRLAIEISVPYERVLNAMLEDQGYRGDLMLQIRNRVNDVGMSGTHPGILDVASGRARNEARLNEEDQRALADLERRDAQQAVRGQRGRTRAGAADEPDGAAVGEL